MSPPHHPEPPERASEPQFVAAPGPDDGHVPGIGARLDGPMPVRPGPRSLLPWVLLSAVVAAAVWAVMTVGLPLRREALQCQAQLLAAQSAFALAADEEAPAAQEEVTAGGAASQDSVDALVERLVMALGPEAALGQVAVHPDEGCVRVVLPGDVAGQDALYGLLDRVGRQAAAMPTPWRVALEVGRPEWGGVKAAQSKHKRREPASVLLLLRALEAADRAFGGAHVPWVTQFVGRPDGCVVLRLEAEAQPAP